MAFLLFNKEQGMTGGRGGGGEDKQGEGIPLMEAILHARYQYDGLLSYPMRPLIGQTSAGP